jgi:hypothetical protein
MTPQELYSLRTTNLLPLPRQVQEVIALMQLGPVQQGFVKKPKYPKQPRRQEPENWRAAAITEVRRRTREREDPEYDEVFGMLNKITKATYDKFLTAILEVMTKKTEDSVFRLRVVNLIFAKGVESAMFSELFVNLLVALNEHDAEIAEDLKISCNLDAFTAMYSEDVVTLPSPDDPTFEDAAIRWTKQKDKRRGFSRFMTQLFLRELVTVDVMRGAIQTMLDDIRESVHTTRTPTTEEYVNQLASFVFDTSKLLRGKDIAAPIKEVTTDLVTNAKTLPCLPMRAKFKLEDAQKLL